MVRHRGPTVLEPAHVVVIGRLKSAGAKRAANTGQIGAGLASANHVNHGAQKRVDTHIC